jgi:hypothetical protein
MRISVPGFWTDHRKPTAVPPTPTRTHEQHAVGALTN